MTTINEVNDLIRFCEKFAGQPLTDYQKNVIKAMQSNKRYKLSLHLYVRGCQDVRRVSGNIVVIDDLINEVNEGNL